MRGERVEKLPAKDAKSMNLSLGCSQNGPLPTDGGFLKMVDPSKPYENGQIWDDLGAPSM